MFNRSLHAVAALNVLLSFAMVSAEDAPTSAPATQPTPTLASARELWIEGYYDRAAQQYRLVGQDAGASVDAAVGLARCGLMTGEYEQGLADLDAAAAQGESSADWHTARAELLARVGQYDDAVRHSRRAVELDPRHLRGRVVLGGLLELTGARDQAIEVYEFFDRLLAKQMPPSAEGITDAAQGFYRYSVLTRHLNLNRRTSHVLNEMLQVAYQRVDRTHWPARLAAADLLRSKYNFAEAAEDYEHALRINNNLPEAHVGLGLMALEGWQFEEVERRVAAALTINPRFGPALALRARSKIVERRYDEAIESCRAALEVNPRDVTALSLTAAAYRCKYDAASAQTYVDRALQVNPRCAELYATLGDALGGLRQYADSEAAYLKSIEYEPTNANAQTDLGLMYMQWGHEDRARLILDAAWALDDFNERTYNTLDLLEKLESHARLETEHFVVRYDAEQDWPVATYLARAAEDIYKDVCADFDARLTEPTIVEVLPTQRDFAVRITAKPWIHTVGACTGWVIAMCSPRPGPQTLGPYHFERVLRHEFTHTATLAVTQNRIAHWYTEGLAVHAEASPRSFDWRELLADAVRRDRLFTLESIDWGFIRPQRPTDRELAYAQSEWMVEYIVHRYGYDALMGLLEAYRQAKTQEQVFREVLGVETGEFDRAFAAWAREEAAGWGFDLTPPEHTLALRAAVLIKPSDASLRGRLAKAELDAGDLPRALEAARKAVELDAGGVTGLNVLVEALTIIAAETHSPKEREALYKEAVPHLRRLAEVDADGWLAPKLLGERALQERRYDEALGWFERLKRLCPTHPASYRGLAGIYLRRGQVDEAQPLLLELARMDEHDAEVPADLAGIFAQQDRLGEARYWYTQSLYINPFQPSTHRRLAEVLQRMGDTPAAADEYEVLCKLEPDQAQHFADAAFAYHKLGDASNAQRCATRAAELDPTTPARTLLDSPSQ